MNTSSHHRAPLLLSLLWVGLTAACEDGSHPLAENSPEELRVAMAPVSSPVKDPLTVMTRNLYHGGDIGPVLQVGFSDLKLLTATAAGVWAEVQANDFHERAVALVDEIEDAMPDVIGLQELALFVTFGLNQATGRFDVNGIIDFEAILEGELGARGLPYSFVAVQENTVVMVPVEGFEFGDRFIPTRLVQLAVRDGVLVRQGLHVEEVTQGNYGTVVPLGVDPFGNPIQMKRGWIRVDAQVDGVPHHFVNTHMEIQSFSPFQVMQTEELLNEIVAGLDGVTVLMGDFNSDAAADAGLLTWTPSYGEIIASGFVDSWAMVNPGRASQGLTCCNASDLRNPLPDFDQRIDFIFLRAPGLKGPQGHFPGAMTVEIIGDDAGRKTTPNGLWPSDHAGLVANLWWAPGQLKKLK